ncbi:hypothetical protein TNCV_234361 [Trichonephila clavipes]|uniref:Uncharacterized protein n=1 Tax=Trichonephila clavipes TaxID=2585209 RepID=A0A8X6SUX5_TRICX|nr:hypothetical protein TNCV_234361 [Trichonephila clavipes]
MDPREGASCAWMVADEAVGCILTYHQKSGANTGEWRCTEFHTFSKIPGMPPILLAAADIQVMRIFVLKERASCTPSTSGDHN